jgi:valyl-tRNA synthetase
MPFITEELWHRLGHEDSIALAPYPKPEGADDAAERDMDLLQEMITAVRTIRADRNIDKNKLLEGRIYCRNGALAVAENHLDVVQKIAKVKLALLTEAPPKLEGARSTPDFDLLLETPQADIEAHRARLEKENQQLSKVIADIDRQLRNEKFLKSAPPHIIEGLRQKRADYQSRLDKNLQ